MKALALVPAAIAAILSFNISTASSQQVCGKEYQACMDTCSTRSSKAIQDGCFQGCESKNNFCAEKAYGKRPSGTPAVAAEAKAPARDAAKAQELAKEQEPARNEEPAKAPAPQSAKAQAPTKQVADDRAPQKRAPVRR
jgi:hypothetical protein